MTHNHIKNTHPHAQLLPPAQRDYIEELLARECRGLSAGKTTAFLLDRGLLSYTCCRAYQAQQLTGQLVCQGVTKQEAMQQVAEQMGCSFSTIKNYIYERGR